MLTLEKSATAWSKDHGATWQLADWAFPFSDALTVPTFLNSGRDYAGARDGYVYSYYIHPAWGAGHIEVSTFYWNFTPKWLSADGTQFTMIFTGKDTNDSWNTVAGRFIRK